MSLTWNGFGGNAETISQAATERETGSEFKYVLSLIWSALLEKGIDNAVKDYTASDCKPIVDILKDNYDNSHNIRR